MAAEMLPACYRKIAENLCERINVDATVENLMGEARELRAIEDDLMRYVAAAEMQQWVTTVQTKMWLEMTSKALDQVGEFLHRYWDQREEPDNLLGFLLTCGCRTFRGCGQGARAAELLRQVQELKKGREDLLEVAQRPPLLPVEEVPSSALKMIGRQGTLAEIRRCLEDDHPARIIGICGMAGVGKTVLLQAVNNAMIWKEESHGSSFDLVIWATLSMHSSVDRLQRDIARRCGLSLPDDSGSSWPQLLFNFLNKRRFLLILDDAWVAMDLAEVGIPSPNAKNRSKILFTTRSDHVCSTMDADERIQVDPLNEEDSWELFRTKVPAQILESESIQEHARALAAACGGLPIALITVGRAMASRRASAVWKDARRRILESPAELRGMAEVIAVLKYSFDRLDGDLPKKCLLHLCSSFPDNGDIDVEELVNSLVEEELLGDEIDVEEARARGYTVVEDLKAEFLLLPGSDGDKQVKIHPMVRIMTLSIGEEFWIDWE